jgi:hypothetical protein
MADRKEHAAVSIIQAREYLEHALAELERLPAFDPSAVAFAAHALNITSGFLVLLSQLPQKYGRLIASPHPPRKGCVGNREPEHLGSLEVDDQRKLHRLLHGQVGRRGAFEDLVDIGGGAAQ